MFSTKAKQPPEENSSVPILNSDRELHRQKTQDEKTQQRTTRHGTAALPLCCRCAAAAMPLRWQCVRTPLHCNCDTAAGSLQNRGLIAIATGCGRHDGRSVDCPVGWRDGCYDGRTASCRTLRRDGSTQRRNAESCAGCRDGRCDGRRD